MELLMLAQTRLVLANRRITDRAKSNKTGLFAVILIGLTFFLGCPFVVNGQNTFIRSEVHNIQPKLKKDKAGVYISYSKDERPSSGTSSTDDKYAWLRLHNNLIGHYGLHLR